MIIKCHFFHFYFFNKDISFVSLDIIMKFWTVIHKVLIEGSVSQIFCLGLSSHFMLKNG